MTERDIPLIVVVACLMLLFLFQVIRSKLDERRRHADPQIRRLRECHINNMARKKQQREEKINRCGHFDTCESPWNGTVVCNDCELADGPL